MKFEITDFIPKTENIKSDSKFKTKFPLFIFEEAINWDDVIYNGTNEAIKNAISKKKMPIGFIIKFKLELDDIYPIINYIFYFFDSETIVVLNSENAENLTDSFRAMLLIKEFANKYQDENIKLEVVDDIDKNDNYDYTTIVLNSSYIRILYSILKMSYMDNLVFSYTSDNTFGLKTVLMINCCKNELTYNSSLLDKDFALDILMYAMSMFCKNPDSII